MHPLSGVRGCPQPTCWYGSPRIVAADGSTVDVGARVQDIESRQAVCPQGLRHLYPLGDGRGGLLLRRRWRGRDPSVQQVQHIGGCAPFGTRPCPDISRTQSMPRTRWLPCAQYVRVLSRQLLRVDGTRAYNSCFCTVCRI